VSSEVALRTDRLRTLREQHGWSQRELARVCGLGETQISKYESGQSDPSSTNVKIIAQALEVSIDYLLGASDDPRGQFGQGELSAEERELLGAFRQDRWSGVMRLMADRVPK
jgi:transcriptional regulator with XRE-family HTH domain